MYTFENLHNQTQLGVDEGERKRRMAHPVVKEYTTERE